MAPRDWRNADLLDIVADEAYRGRVGVRLGSKRAVVPLSILGIQ